jgi:hypothetical protein
MRNRDPHQALKSEVVSRNNANYLEILLVRLQWAKDEIGFSAHVNPSSYGTSGIQHTDFLNYLGFSPSNCSFTSGRKCYTRWVDEDFDPKAFGDAFNNAYALLVGAQQGLQNCGFALRQPEGWGYFYGKPSRSSRAGEFSLPGDGHTGMKIESMKQSEDDTFLYRFTWIETGREKGWITHYHPKHPPLSSELQGVFTYLGLQHFNSCPEFDFEPCFFRSVRFVSRGDSPFDSNVDSAHGIFDAHATQFSPAIQKLLSANAEIEQIGFPFLIQGKPMDRLGVDIEIKTKRPEKLKSISVATPRTPMNAKPRAETVATPESFDVAISFAGTERVYAQRLAEIVRNAGHSVFYDEFFPEYLWGKNLYVTFDEIFRKRARFCVIFVSKDYKDRAWTNREIQSAQARALNEKGGEYILPIKVDDTELDGMHPTIGYIPLTTGIEKIGELLIKKLNL